MATVSLKKLTKRYGSTAVVHGIDLEVADREFIALVGPSGCGKSTTLRMIAGLEEISDGVIEIGGRMVNDLPPRSRNISMVFQSYALYPHMTVRENMGFSLKIAGAPKEEMERRVAEASAILGLDQLLERRPVAAFRRPAPARRHGPRHRARPRRLPVRRAALQPRRQAAHADAHRDQEAARQGALDGDLRHARPGRGDDAGRPHRHHARRPYRAGRHARRGVPAARRRASSPASSARRR